VSELGDGSPPVEPLGAWRTLVRSFGALAVGEVGARVLGFVAIVWMARQLEPAGFGLVTLGATLVVWFSLVVDSGTEVLKTRDISRDPHRLKEIAEPVIGLRLALSLVAVAVFVLAASFAAEQPSDRKLLWLFALVLPATALNLRWMVLGVGASKTVAVANIASQVLFMTGVLILVRNRHDIWDVPVLQAGGALIYAVVVLGALTRRFGLIRPRIDLSAWLTTLRESFPLFVNAVARTVVYSFSIILIAVLLGREDVGLYGAASKPVLFFIGAIGLFSISFLASFSAATTAEIPGLFSRVLRVALVVTVPAALSLSIGAKLFVRFAYGENYSGASMALALLAWSLPFMVIAALYGNVLIARNHQKALMRNNVVAAAFAVVASLVAVHFMGIEGAAVATVASHLLVALLNQRECVRRDFAPGLTLALRVPTKMSYGWKSD
jgi:PST family polysaccharide transporter